MIRRSSITILITVASMLLATGASAASPPMVDQYTEQVPTPGGDRPSQEVPDPSPSGGGGSGSPSVGADGSSTGETQAAGSSSNPSGSNGGSSAPGSDRPSQGSAVNESDSNAGPTASQITSEAESDTGGMGLIFPVLLAVAALVAAASVVVRMRGGAESRSG